MGWPLILASVASLLTGDPSLTAMDNKREDSLSGNPCLDRDVPLNFKEGSPYPDSSFLGPMHWALRAKVECRGFSLRVRGLPAPSSRTLEGQRASKISVLLDSFGLSSVRFVQGRQSERANPRIEIRARK